MNTYKIADKIIEINSVYPNVHELCCEYAFDGKADICLTTTQADIEYEKKVSAIESAKEGHPERTFSEGYLETLAAYRKLAEALLEFDTFLFHGSAIEVDGESYIFTAKSGTGKSTHTRLWREYFGERAVMINDDKPLIKLNDHGAVVFGTPWDGKHHLSVNASAPLKAVCVLERGKENSIERLNKSEAYPILLAQIYRPRDPDNMVKTLALADRLCGAVTLHRLKCNMDIEAARVAYEGMNK